MSKIEEGVVIDFSEYGIETDIGKEIVELLDERIDSQTVGELIKDNFVSKVEEIADSVVDGQEADKSAHTDAPMMSDIEKLKIGDPETVKYWIGDGQKHSSVDLEKLSVGQKIDNIHDIKVSINKCYARINEIENLHSSGLIDDVNRDNTISSIEDKISELSAEKAHNVVSIIFDTDSNLYGKLIEKAICDRTDSEAVKHLAHDFFGRTTYNPVNIARHIREFIDERIDKELEKDAEKESDVKVEIDAETNVDKDVAEVVEAEVVQDAGSDNKTEGDKLETADAVDTKGQDAAIENTDKPDEDHEEKGDSETENVETDTGETDLSAAINDGETDSNDEKSPEAVAEESDSQNDLDDGDDDHDEITDTEIDLNDYHTDLGEGDDTDDIESLDSSDEHIEDSSVVDMETDSTEDDDESDVEKDEAALVKDEYQEDTEEENDRKGKADDDEAEIRDEYDDVELLGSSDGEEITIIDDSELVHTEDEDETLLKIEEEQEVLNETHQDDEEDEETTSTDSVDLRNTDDDTRNSNGTDESDVAEGDRDVTESDYVDTDEYIEYDVDNIPTDEEFDQIIDADAENINDYTPDTYSDVESEDIEEYDVDLGDIDLHMPDDAYEVTDDHLDTAINDSREIGETDKLTDGETDLFGESDLFTGSETVGESDLSAGEFDIDAAIEGEEIADVVAALFA